MIDDAAAPAEKRRMLVPRWLAIGAVVVGALSLAGCSDLIKKLKGDKNADGTSAGDDDTTGKPKSGCVIPDSVAADVTVKKGCSVVLKHNVTVVKGATLTIEPGVKVSVGEGIYLWVEDGKLLAKGTASDPIVFTSANKTQAPGDWVGIFFDSKTQAGTELDFVHVEFAGSSASGGRGAIDVKNQSSPKRISIANVTVTQSALSGIVNDSEKGGFAKFEHNTFKKNKSSLEAHTRVLGTVGVGNTFGDPLITKGTVNETTTWPAFDAPILVKEKFDIGGDTSPAVLTIAPRTILKMNPGTYISVGTANGGSLTANNVTFTSSNATPQVGDWVGLFIYAKTSVLQLDSAIIEYAGSDASGGRAAITFYGTTAKSVRGGRITNVTFRHNGVAAMASSDNDCSPFLATNRSDVPLCRAP